MRNNKLIICLDILNLIFRPRWLEHNTCLVHLNSNEEVVTMIFCRRKSVGKAMSGGIEPATLRRKTFSGQGLELVVSLLLCVL